MVEIKESKESKTPDVTRLVDDSMARLHDLERRLHAVQGHLSGLVNAANSLHVQQPPANVPTGLPWASPEVANLPQFAFPFAGPSASALFGAPAYGAAAFGSPASTPVFGAPTQAFPSATPAPNRSPTPWPGSLSPTPGITGAGLSARDFDKLPAVARVPEVNFVDSGDKYLIRIELPGVRKDDLDITVSERMITIDADARQEIGEGTVLVGEVVPAVYRRSIALPTSCNSAKCKASLKDGFLNLELPKKEPTEGPRRLDVAYG